MRQPELVRSRTHDLNCSGIVRLLVLALTLLVWQSGPAQAKGINDLLKGAADFFKGGGQAS